MGCLLWLNRTRQRGPEYLADPEGHLTGVEERGIIRDYLEDVEADRRWQARQARRG